MHDIDTLRAHYLSQIDTTNTLADLDSLRVRALGRKGDITERLRTLGQLSPADRRIVGPALNALKTDIATALNARKAVLHNAVLDAKIANECIDVTLPERFRRIGTIHPISYVTQEIIDILARFEFSVSIGPQIETEWYNFDALNIPPHHPARAEMDTFYIANHTKTKTKTDTDTNAGIDADSMVLRTHTSPVQVRALQKHGAPLRVIAPGRVYRCDYDQTHTPMFHQVEGLAIDRALTMAHLKWTLEAFLKAFFETDAIDLRFRSAHFPFTEPSAEVDVRCHWDQGTVRIGQGKDWLEILGCGMVHPNVLHAADIDSTQWQGFAFGIGIDRLAMLKYGMNDLRAFFDADVRWLAHYGFYPHTCAH